MKWSRGRENEAPDNNSYRLVLILDIYLSYLVNLQHSDLNASSPTKCCEQTCQQQHLKLNGDLYLESKCNMQSSPIYYILTSPPMNDSGLNQAKDRKSYKQKKRCIRGSRKKLSINGSLSREAFNGTFSPLRQASATSVGAFQES